jgi:hypothetical protein
MGAALNFDAPGTLGAGGSKGDAMAQDKQRESDRVNSSAADGGPTNGAKGDGSASAKQAPQKNTKSPPKQPPNPKHPSRFGSSLLPQKGALPPEFAQSIQELEAAIKRPVLMLIQTGSSAHDYLGWEVADMFVCAKNQLPPDPVALLLDSPGGQARDAYRIASFLKRQHREFMVLIPRYAKSAATLLSLGGRPIMMGDDAEIGPLDAQIQDADRGEVRSALDEVQVFERLHASALETLDQTVFFLLNRTGKKLELLLPTAQKLVTELMRPIMEKVDTVQYTRVSRILKVAEEYAVRLLDGLPNADVMASELVEKYPSHDFVINREEAARIGLPVVETPRPVQRIFDKIRPHLRAGVTALGRLKEVSVS